MELKGGTNSKIKHVEHTGFVKCIQVQNFCEIAQLQIEIKLDGHRNRENRGK